MTGETMRLNRRDFAKAAGLALALWVYARFDPALGREAGNDGLYGGPGADTLFD